MGYQTHLAEVRSCERVESSLRERLQKGFGRRFFTQILLCNWCDNSLLSSSYLTNQIKSKSHVKFMSKKMILAFNTYDWLTTSTKCLSRMDEATYTFTLLLVFIIFYYKSLHDGSFQKYASLESQAITLLSHYSIYP